MLRPVQYIGFFIVIFASIALNLKQTTGLKLNKAFYLMFLSSFLLACRMILAKAALEIDTTWINVMVYPHLISGALAFLFLVPKKFRQDIHKQFKNYLAKLKTFITIEVVYFFGIACSVYALTKLSPVISSAIEATEPIFLLVFVSIVGHFYHMQFKEFDIPFMKKMICFLLMVLGIALIS